MTESNQENFPTMKASNNDDSPLQEFPSFCPPVSLMGGNNRQENPNPSLFPFPRMRKPQTRGLSIPMMNIQTENKSNGFNLSPDFDDQTPPSPSSALPKLVTLNSSSSKVSPRGSVPTSGRKTALTTTIPKASPLKPVCLQTIIPRRRNASVLARITNVNSPL